jgi:hypothetical protein
LYSPTLSGARVHVMSRRRFARSFSIEPRSLFVAAVCMSQEDVER